MTSYRHESRTFGHRAHQFSIGATLPVHPSEQSRRRERVAADEFHVRSNHFRRVFNDMCMCAFVCVGMSILDCGRLRIMRPVEMRHIQSMNDTTCTDLSLSLKMVPR